MCKLSANQLSLYFSLISPELIEIELHGFKNEIFHHPGTILNKAHPLQTTYQNPSNSNPISLPFFPSRLSSSYLPLNNARVREEPSLKMPKKYPTGFSGRG